MKANDIVPGRNYVYSPVNTETFKRRWESRAYSAYSVWKVRVLATEVQRWSESTSKDIYNGIKVEYLGLQNADGQNITEVVAPNRIKRLWTNADNDWYKAQLQEVEEKNLRRKEQKEQREQQVALSQYQASILQEHALTITDVLEANGLEPDVDFTVEKYERGVVLRGDGITKLLDILV